jgi:L-aspartate oxidase
MLVSEAVRGEGAVLRSTGGLAFMPGYDPRADLAPRDIVARAIVAEIRSTAADHVLLDCRPISERMDIAARFPSVFAGCLLAGYDMRTDPVPVAPAAHYLMGGVRTDTLGRTTIAGLYACGEVACTGVHGANRLASNSLLETVVFGKRIVEHLASGEGGAAAPWPGEVMRVAPPAGSCSRAALQDTMWESAGIERNAAGLRDGIARLAAPDADAAEGTRDAFELRQMRTLGGLMLRTALARTESRGAHYRTDYPGRDDAHWQRSLVVAAGE